MNHPIEPSADMRDTAVALRGMYNAYVDVGFNPGEALLLLAAHIRSAGAGERTS